MLEPVERERLEAAIKAAINDAGLTISETGRRLGRGAQWVASVLQRVRNGHALTVETVRIMRVELPSLEAHLGQAGWSSFGGTPRGRPVPSTRNTEHLRRQRNNLMLQRDQLDREIVELTAQIAELEGIAAEAQKTSAPVARVNTEEIGCTMCGNREADTAMGWCIRCVREWSD